MRFYRLPFVLTFPPCNQFYSGYDKWHMNKSHPAPNVPGDTPAERLSNALNRVLKVSKADLLKEEARLRSNGEKKRAKRKRAS